MKTEKIKIVFWNITKFKWKTICVVVDKYVPILEAWYENIHITLNVIVLERIQTYFVKENWCVGAQFNIYPVENSGLFHSNISRKMY